MFKIRQYPHQVRLARFTSTQQQSDLRRHPTMIGKVHLPFTNQPSHFLPQPAFSMSSSASLSSFDLQPFSRHGVLSSQHMTIPTSIVCHGQLIYGFIQTQHEHQIRRSFSVFELYSKHCSHNESFCKFHISLSFRHHSSLPCSIAGLT